MSQRDGTRARAQQVDDVELPAAGIWLVWKLVCCAGVLLGGAGACMELAAAGVELGQTCRGVATWSLLADERLLALGAHVSAYRSVNMKKSWRSGIHFSLPRRSMCVG